MSSIIEGYNYDIFISYRQKDNKYDGWVTEFVDNLRKELEATFKEEISVYFDVNPHDGLLETHDVDESLKEKLKCLIFIPIISRTYCDPKSFAWEHEFKAFAEQASKDQFGLKIKLPSGNVASRVLPVRIHDLDSEDIKECELVLGGALRGIEFIYKEPGIDKPLAPDDDEKKNLNNTKYRIQIIKVAHAVKEIILGMRSEPVKVVKEKDQPKELFKEAREEKGNITLEKPAKANKFKLLTIAAIAVLLVIAAILAYPKIFNRNTIEKLRSSGKRISIAVMPFQNMTNDTTLNIWQDGIQNELVNNLTNSEELQIRQIESITDLIINTGHINAASLTPSVASTISQKLDASIFIYGSLKQEGSTIRLNTQLIDSKTEEVFKSFQIDGTADNILQITDSLSIIVKNFLIISVLEKEMPVAYWSAVTASNSPEAYRYLIYGNKSFYNRDYSTARNWYLQALNADSNFTTAEIYIAVSCANLFLFDESKKWCMKVYKSRNLMPLNLKIMTDWLHAATFETPFEEIKYLKQLLEIDDQRPLQYFILGGIYNGINQYDKAIPEFEKSLEITNKWGVKPIWELNYAGLGLAYHETGQYKKEKRLYKKAERDFPDNDVILYRQAILAFTEGKIKDANEYIEKYQSVRKDRLATEATIKNSIATIYSESGVLDKAEEYYRQALLLEPENPTRMNNLAWFLIDKDRNLNEGLELIDRALELVPDDPYSIDTKGWGLYKKGRYKEALELLERCWDLRSGYDHEIHLHLEAAKKAVAGQKNN
jgi:tetratricopeptide (TPR) repeat protein/TolB-like protein